MTTAAVITMVSTMSIVTLFAAYFFRKIIIIPRKSDLEDTD
ncbi:MAG: hypothetical protein OEV30_03040 [Ignavibacteria bacterium]|nr:hypothetical protein [Ignavibacteria bacterium]